MWSWHCCGSLHPFHQFWDGISSHFTDFPLCKIHPGWCKISGKQYQFLWIFHDIITIVLLFQVYCVLLRCEFVWKKNRWRVSSFKLQSFAVAKNSYIYSSGRKNEPRKMWCPWLALAAWVLRWFYCRDDMEMRIQVVTFHHNCVVDSIHTSYINSHDCANMQQVCSNCNKNHELIKKTQLCSIIWRVTKARIVQYQVLAGQTKWTAWQSQYEIPVFHQVHSV